MDDIYANVEYDKPVNPRLSTNQTGPRSSGRRFHGAVLCLGLLSVFLLAGIIGLSVHSAELSTIKTNLTERLQASENKSSSLTEERDRLNSRLTEMAEELDRLQQKLSTIKTNLTERLQASENKSSSLTEERDRLNSRLTVMAEELDRLQQKKPCPAEWRTFCSSCYLLSAESGSWEKGRQDCRDRGADLVVIDSSEEQTFLFKFVKKDTWFGLTDKDQEGTWKWVDGTPLTLKNWEKGQPDNGGGNPKWGEEDCAHFVATEWNDRSCVSPMNWICEKKA
ncbi:CD209 antigen-like protein C isoform X2 [Etheostoma cragini]|uniref:CD209 antigen-like protein C isoform X2 n=1 Tax=Etheostoma cragini TaxID=417921 RepID=UPI00155DE031|nr:CD209 antigen-like protein C isoform X2 [Etheostoma cragini]